MWAGRSFLRRQSRRVLAVLTPGTEEAYASPSASWCQLVQHHGRRQSQRRKLCPLLTYLVAAGAGGDDRIEVGKRVTL
jgi:hypothetical protein